MSHREVAVRLEPGDHEKLRLAAARVGVSWGELARRFVVYCLSEPGVSDDRLVPVERLVPGQRFVATVNPDVEPTDAGLGVILRKELAPVPDDAEGPDGEAVPPDQDWEDPDEVEFGGRQRIVDYSDPAEHVEAPDVNRKVKARVSRETLKAAGDVPLDPDREAAAQEAARLIQQAEALKEAKRGK